MALIVDRREGLSNAPGVHALIVGVSQYEKLPGVDDPPDVSSWNLTSLVSPALSAALLANWLLEKAEPPPPLTTDLALPLKTLRLLLAPSLLEVLPPMPGAPTIPRREAFASAVSEWHNDCRDSRDSIALLYYAGHGFTRGRGDNNLLLTMSDLFEAGRPRLANVALASNLFNGMAPQTAVDTVARRQFFVFDCCHTFPEQLAQFDDRSVPPILDVLVSEGVADDREFARFHAVPDNMAAFASKGRPTYFAQCLLDALENAGRKVPNRALWTVDGNAIAGRLRVRYQQLTGLKLVQQVAGSGPALRNLAAPPMVDISIQLDPMAAATGRGVALENGTRLVIGTETKVGLHKIQVAPGQYELKVQPPAGAWISTGDSQIVLPDFENPWVAVGWP
jgi:hypothetical protein